RRRRRAGRWPRRRDRHRPRRCRLRRDPTMPTTSPATGVGVRSGSAEDAAGRSSAVERPGPARPGRAVARLLLLTRALAMPTAVLAQEMPRLQGQVTDLTRAQVLAGGRAQIDRALSDLLQGQNVQLWVLFVETTGDRTVTEFADEVARRNSLGGNDALLVVALTDRTSALWRGSSSLQRLTDRALEGILSRP